MQQTKTLWMPIKIRHALCIQVLQFIDVLISNAYSFWCIFSDKNHHPQAEEAMKKVTKAREILSDAITRREYDLTIQPNENLRANVENYGYDDYPFDHSHQNWWSTEV